MIRMKQGWLRDTLSLDLPLHRKVLLSGLPYIITFLGFFLLKMIFVSVFACILLILIDETSKTKIS